MAASAARSVRLTYTGTISRVLVRLELAIRERRQGDADIFAPALFLAIAEPGPHQHPARLVPECTGKTRQQGAHHEGKGDEHRNRIARQAHERLGVDDGQA